MDPKSGLLGHTLQHHSKRQRVRDAYDMPDSVLRALEILKVLNTHTNSPKYT